MAEDPMMDATEVPSANSPTQLFRILAAILGGIAVLGIIIIGALLLMRGGRQAAEDKNATALALNTEIASTATALANLPTNTPIPTNTPVPTETTVPTDTQVPSPVPPTETPVVAPSETLVVAPSDTPTGSETAGAQTTATATEASTATATLSAASITRTAAAAGGGPTATGSPGTPLGTTATKLPSRTPTPGQTGTRTAAPGAGTPGTGTPGAGGANITPTQLPNTGFADDVGVSNLVIMGLALVAIVIIARRLRYSLR